MTSRPYAQTRYLVWALSCRNKTINILPRLAAGAKRLTDLSRDTALGGAQSKDIEDAHLTHAARTFSTTEARERDLRNVDVAHGAQQDAAVLVLGPGRKTVAQPLDAGIGG